MRMINKLHNTIALSDDFQHIVTQKHSHTSVTVYKAFIEDTG